MIIRDYLICLLQMYLLEDLEKNILPYRRERFWEKFLVYCIAALAMFGTNRLESSILNMVMIPVIYMIASMVVFRGNIWKKLVTVCCYYVLAIIPEFLFAALTNAYGVTGASEGFRTETEKTLALLLMSTMTFLFIKCINQVTRKRDYLTIENKTFTVLLMLPTATIVMLGCMFYSHTSFEGMNRVMVPVGASLLLMTNIFIFTVFDRFVEKSEEVKKMDRLYQKSRAEIANLQYMNNLSDQGIAEESVDIVIAAGMMNNAVNTDYSMRQIICSLVHGGIALIAEPVGENYELMLSQSFMMSRPTDAREVCNETFLKMEEWKEVFWGCGISERELVVVPSDTSPLAPLNQKLFIIRKE